MAELGVHSVAYAFPQVKIITTAVDKGLDHLLHVIPGIGTSASPPGPPNVGAVKKLCWLISGGGATRV